MFSILSNNNWSAEYIKERWMERVPWINFFLKTDAWRQNPTEEQVQVEADEVFKGVPLKDKQQLNLYVNKTIWWRLSQGHKTTWRSIFHLFSAVGSQRQQRPSDLPLLRDSPDPPASNWINVENLVSDDHVYNSPSLFSQTEQRISLLPALIWNKNETWPMRK